MTSNTQQSCKRNQNPHSVWRPVGLSSRFLQTICQLPCNLLVICLKHFHLPEILKHKTVRKCPSLLTKSECLKALQLCGIFAKITNQDASLTAVTHPVGNESVLSNAWSTLELWSNTSMKTGFSAKSIYRQKATRLAVMGRSAILWFRDVMDTPPHQSALW